MKSSHERIIRCPLNKVFLAVADLSRWPEFLSHYRYNRFLTRTPAGGVVKMSCYRFRVPLEWVAEYRIDTVNHRLSFHHVDGVFKATRGLDILWEFHEHSDSSTRVVVTYEFNPSVIVGGRLLAGLVLGDLFVHNLAERMLDGLQRKLEVQLAPAEKFALRPAKSNTVPVRGQRIRRRISSRSHGPV